MNQDPSQSRASLMSEAMESRKSSFDSHDPAAHDDTTGSNPPVDTFHNTSHDSNVTGEPIGDKARQSNGTKATTSPDVPCSEGRIGFFPDLSSGWKKKSDQVWSFLPISQRNQ